MRNKKTPQRVPVLPWRCGATRNNVDNKLPEEECNQSLVVIQTIQTLAGVISPAPSTIKTTVSWLLALFHRLTDRSNNRSYFGLNLQMAGIRVVVLCLLIQSFSEGGAETGCQKWDRKDGRICCEFCKPGEKVSDKLSQSESMFSPVDRTSSEPFSLKTDRGSGFVYNVSSSLEVTNHNSFCGFSVNTTTKDGDK